LSCDPLRAFALTRTTRRPCHEPGKELAMRRLRNAFCRVVASSLWEKDEDRASCADSTPQDTRALGRSFPPTHAPEPVRVRTPSTWPMPSTDAGSFDARSRSTRPIPRVLQARFSTDDETTIAIRTTDFCYRTILTSTHDSCCYPRQWVITPLRRSPSGDLRG